MDTFAEARKGEDRRLQADIALAGCEKSGWIRVASLVLDVPEVETPLAVPVHLCTLVYMIRFFS